MFASTSSSRAFPPLSSSAAVRLSVEKGLIRLLFQPHKLGEFSQQGLDLPEMLLRCV